MNRKHTVMVLALVLLLMGGAGAAAAVYLRADRQKPELTLRSDVVTEFGQSLSMYELIDWVDDESSFTLSVSCPQGTLTPDGKGVSFPGVGSYQVELTARDEHGNSATETTVVEVVDTTPPELKAEEFTVYVGKDLEYQTHVSATDAADGDLTAAVQCSALQVDLHRPGRYPVSYTVTDRSGNTASLTSYVTVIYPPAKKIRLSQTELWLAGNEYAQLKVKVKPSDWHGTVEWESSRPEVAQVSDGLVVWTGEGECVITARAGKKKASCTVHCEPPVATEVRLDQHKLKLEENGTASLIARVLPSNWSGAVTWWSSNPAVAVVDEFGTVTWVGGGTCTITASVGELSDECQIECRNSSIQSFWESLFGPNDNEQQNQEQHGAHEQQNEEQQDVRHHKENRAG